MSGKTTKTEKCKDRLEAKRVNAEPLRPQRNVCVVDALTDLCVDVLSEHMANSKGIDLVGRDIPWQMGMIAWNIVVTDREELADGVFAGTKLNDEQQGMVRREISGLVERMRRLYPRAGRTIMAVSGIMKNGELRAKVQPGEEFPMPLEIDREKRALPVMTAVKFSRCASGLRWHRSAWEKRSESLRERSLPGNTTAPSPMKSKLLKSVSWQAPRQIMQGHDEESVSKSFLQKIFF